MCWKRQYQSFLSIHSVYICFTHVCSHTSHSSSPPWLLKGINYQKKKMLNHFVCVDLFVNVYAKYKRTNGKKNKKDLIKTIQNKKFQTKDMAD